MDIGAAVQVNATVLSVAVAIGAIYASVVYAAVYRVRAAIFTEALKANNLVRGFVILNASGSTMVAEPTTETQVRDKLLFRVLRLLSGEQAPDLPKDDPTRGLEILLSMGWVANDYPFRVDNFSDRQVVEQWMSDMFAVTRSPATLLMPIQETERARLVAAYEGAYPLSQASQRLNALIDAYQSGERLAITVRSMLHQYLDALRRLPAKRWIVGALLLATLTALVGVFLPLLWPNTPWWLYSAVPAVVYCLASALAIVCLASALAIVAVVRRYRPPPKSQPSTDSAAKGRLRRMAAEWIRRFKDWNGTTPMANEGGAPGSSQG